MEYLKKIRKLSRNHKSYMVDGADDTPDYQPGKVGFVGIKRKDGVVEYIHFKSLLKK